MREDELRTNFPWIKWDEPVMVSSLSASGIKYFGCRFCIAMRGLRGKDIENLPKTRQEYNLHVKTYHSKAFH